LFSESVAGLYFQGFLIFPGKAAFFAFVYLKDIHCVFVVYLFNFLYDKTGIQRIHKKG